MITVERFNEIFNPKKIGKKKVIIFGDAILDEFNYCDMTRLSPEGQHPILKLKNILYRPGGAANVAVICRNLGLETTLVYGCGNREDIFESILRRTLDVLKIIWSRFLVDIQGQQIPVKKRIVVDDKILFRLDNERFIPCELNIEDYNLDEYDAVIISDYGKGTLSQHFVCDLIIKCNELNIPIFVDPDIGKNQIFYRECTYYKCNEKESNRLGFDSLQGKNVIVTKGDKGCWFFEKENENLIQFEKDKQFETKSVIGAGDCFISALCASVLYGAHKLEAIELANSVAGFYTSLDVCDMIQFKMLKENLYKDSNKIVEQKWLVERLASERKCGKKIVFVSGCFDLLHKEHIKFLKQAKESGDILIVGLHSDYSVKSKKGETRPIMDFQNRSEILSSIECIDYIVKIENGCLEQLIERLVPHILFEGKDYIDKEIVGKDFVESFGGEVKFSNTEQDITSTIIINKCFHSRLDEIEKEEILEVNDIIESSVTVESDVDLFLINSDFIKIASDVYEETKSIDTISSEMVDEVNDEQSISEFSNQQSQKINIKT